jgi:putative glutamine amidotransferase
MPAMPIRIIVPMNLRGPAGDSPEQVCLNEAYVRLVHDAGAMAVLVPPFGAFSDEPAEAYRCQGLLLTGGADLDPSRYGQPPHPQNTPLHPRREAAELAWFAWADRRGLPILGICLGCQVINVGRGGSLIQHLPDRPATLEHARSGGEAMHDVTITGPLLERIVGPVARSVNSRHHQAIEKPGRGLRVAARSDDGVIEAVEDDAGRFVLGLQWHAEDLPDHPATKAIMQAFLLAGNGQAPAKRPANGN